MEKIPEKVMQRAFSEGFNQVNYLGLHEGAKAYAAGSIDPDGHPLPTGLPTIILLKDGRTDMICGEEGLDLLGKFIYTSPDKKNSVLDNTTDTGETSRGKRAE